MFMLTIGIILGSARPNRYVESIALWVLKHARARADARYELIDIRDFNLALADETTTSARRYPQPPHTKRWAEAIAWCDAFVFVVPDHSHGTTEPLKNAIDYLYAEWHHKSAGFVSYGNAASLRAVEQLRVAIADVQLADVGTAVRLLLSTDFKNFWEFAPDPRHETILDAMLDQVISWGGALKTIRVGASGITQPQIRFSNSSSVCDRGGQLQ
jgi:NAD(P)H-dependent FMN reductase